VLRVVIPMHYKTGKLSLPIVVLRSSYGAMRNVKRLGTEVEVNAGSLPTSPGNMGA